MNKRDMIRLHRAIKRIEEDLARLPWRPGETVTSVPDSAARVANGIIEGMMG